MANSVFARKQLLKHGWTDGSGLGKDESGIKEAIKVKIKNDTTGVGHDPGKEFTCHWWDHVFNKAASSITVETTEEGVLFKNSSEEVKQNAKTLNNKTVLYAGFVKGAVLQATDKEVMAEVSCHDDSESESEDEEANKAISKLTEAELFSQCEGRTAHKGARHGLKQNAKLLRIQRQEQLMLDQIRSRANQKDLSKLSNGHEQQTGKEVGQQSPELEDNVSPLTTVSDETVQVLRKKKKKKSKKRAKDVDIETEAKDDLILKIDILQKEESETLVESENISSKKHKKSKKKKRTAVIDEENSCKKIKKSKTKG